MEHHDINLLIAHTSYSSRSTYIFNLLVLMRTTFACSINHTGWTFITEHPDTFTDAITAEAMKAFRYDMWSVRAIL